jgi:hypothetical protein
MVLTLHVLIPNEMRLGHSRKRCLVREFAADVVMIMNAALEIPASVDWI